MGEFWIFVEVGLHHVLDASAYDHILFLLALVVPYTFNDWKRILLLVTTFTVGHTLALVLSVLGVLTIKPAVVEFLIPVTILLTAAYNLFTAGKSARKESVNLVGFLTFFFGLIHGLGFSNYFKSLLSGNFADKLVPMTGFATGIELAQLTVVLVVLLISFILQHFARFSRRDFILVLSAIVLGMTVPMLVENALWNP